MPGDKVVMVTYASFDEAEEKRSGHALCRLTETIASCRAEICMPNPPVATIKLGSWLLGLPRSER